MNADSAVAKAGNDEDYHNGSDEKCAAHNLLAAVGVAQRSALQAFLDRIRNPMTAASAHIMNYHVMQIRSLWRQSVQIPDVLFFGLLEI
jgi:hypothetical protein